MKRLLPAFVFLMVFSWFGVVPASVTTGTIRVTVRDTEGEPLRGAQVTAESLESLAKRTVNTDAKGEAVLLALDPSAKYVVTTFFTGYISGRNDNVLVRTGETTNVRVELTPGLTETVHVVAQSPLVDVTTAMVAQDITLELTDSLPTLRTYQGYLQLVPGVGIALSGQGWGADPPSRSGLNYTPSGSGPGTANSADNVYYIEGINVTDIYNGLARTNFNTEAIQEQNVITGGIPAEYKGAPGLISNVVTKSGGNRFSGSLNYYFQNNHLLANDRRNNFVTEDFSTYDTAFTLGGPIRQDKVWFFLSYRKLNRKDYVLNAAPGGFSRTVETDEDQSYAKLTWQLTNKDRLSGTFLADPWDSSGERNANIVNNRLEITERGAPRYIADYQRVFNSGVLTLGAGRHAGTRDDTPVLLEPKNDVLFDTATQSFTIADEQLGGAGQLIDTEDANEFINGSTEWLVNSSWGRHTIKGGFVYEDHRIAADSARVGNAGYQSLGMPMTADHAGSGNLSGPANWDGYSWRFNGLIATIDTLPNRASFYALLDLDSDATITMAEAGQAMFFNSTAGNPHGAINYWRVLQADPNVSRYGSEGLSLYLQDTLRRGRWSFNVGVRAEKWEHFAETGERIMKFDWEYAPRLSVIRDVKGDGKQKLSVFYGRYYDPVRNDLTKLAGTLLGPLLQGQVFVNGEWVTYVEVGGLMQADTVFAPTTKTPYTDEWQLGYEIDLGHSMSLAANVIKRETRDLLDDYYIADFVPEAEGGSYPDALVDHPQSLALGLDYFGLEQLPSSDYVFATLAGGRRDWEGAEVILRKRLVHHWQAIASYSYSDGHGNSVSDSSFSLQSDNLFLDPRAPNAAGRLPGTVHHLVKLLGSYNWDNGFKLGGTYRWNSGFIENKLVQGGVPMLTGLSHSTDPDFEFAGITGTWIQAGSVGTLEGPTWGVLDIRAQYNHRFGSVTTEFFVDVFSVFNDQATTRLYPGVHANPAPGEQLGDPWGFAPPRRFYLGARASF